MANQKQHSNTPLKWDNTGVIVEDGAYNRYTIKVDQSGRLTDRNGRFLHAIWLYKEIIGKPAPTVGAPAANVTVPPQTQVELKRTARITKKTPAATTGRRPSRK